MFGRSDIARKGSSSAPSRRSFDCRLEGYDQAGHGFGGDHDRLVLGLLVSSAKGAYDTKRSEVIQMAAKVALLDRVFGLYGLEAAEARAGFHAAVEEAVWQMWPEEGGRRRSWLPTRKQA